MMQSVHKSNDITTEELIQRCLRGDQSAYEALYHQYAPALVRLCYSLVLHTQDAEDVVQDSFVYAFKNLVRFDARRSSFKTWLYTIALSRCRNVYRSHRRSLIDLSQVLLPDLPAPDTERPEKTLEWRDAADAIAASLAELSPRLREVIVLRHGHGLTYREIAEIVDCPPKTAESRVRLAHEKLRQLLEPRGQMLLEALAWA